MVVYDGELSPFVQRVMQELLYTLWDLGLPGRPQPALARRLRGHGAHRLPQPHLDAGGAASSTATAGSSRASGACCATTSTGTTSASSSTTTLAERDQRYRKYGASPYIGEPNVKESAGGLRDMHTAMWLGAAKFGARTLRELADKGLITAARAGRRRRRPDVPVARAQRAALLLRPQERRADARPAAARSPRTSATRTTARRLGVERFMRDYYLHARRIHRMSRRLIARCQETLSRRGLGRAAPAPAGAGRRAGVLRRPAPPGRPRPRPRCGADPARLMKVFWHLHRLGCDLSPDLERAVEDSLDVVDDGFRRSPAVRDLFLDICRALGPGGADAVGDARARAAGPLPAGVRRADLPGAVRRLSQVLGRPALAAGRRAPGGAGARASPRNPRAPPRSSTRWRSPSS